MLFERTTDYKLVRSIMTHPKLYPWCTDDFSPAAEDYSPPEHEAVWYVLVKDAGELLGLFAFVPQNGICWELHTRLLPEAWGPRALEALRCVIAWLWENTSCRRLVTNVPTFNRLALRFGRAAGLVEFGRNELSFLKNGVAYDQVLLGATKPGEN
jgi:RimJ/RimL family protein N-acetyltransferase